MAWATTSWLWGGSQAAKGWGQGREVRSVFLAARRLRAPRETDCGHGIDTAIPWSTKMR